LHCPPEAQDNAKNFLRQPLQNRGDAFPRFQMSDETRKFCCYRKWFVSTQLDAAERAPSTTSIAS